MQESDVDIRGELGSSFVAQRPNNLPDVHSFSKLARSIRGLPTIVANHIVHHAHRQEVFAFGPKERTSRRL
jgi:hypothetical protein